MSGDRAFEALAPHIEGPGGGREPWTRGMRPARLVGPVTRMPVLLLAFPAPRSYTGQAAVELSLPGNPVLLERIVDELIESACGRGIDARRAEPGEFTARAFLSGRLSLTQAEGVAATIAARSDADLSAARLLSSGAMGTLARRLADDVAAALALVEADIDFTDQEDVVAIAPADLLERLGPVVRAIDDQLSRAVGREHLDAIPWVVLTGAPNAGKSTLFNALLGHERAVVSSEAGTTRDVLTEPLALAGPRPGHGTRPEVMLVDLAGLDPSYDPLNRQMQEHARAAIERAELILHCAPIGEPSPPPPPAGPMVLVRTKIDRNVGREAGTGDAFRVSARTGEGLDALREAISDRLGDRAVSLAADATVVPPRHDAALRTALAGLREAVSLVAPHACGRALADAELVAAALRSSLDALASLAGDVTPDDVLGRIFASFCVGK